MIDTDVFYFQDRNLEMKHVVDASQWREHFNPSTVFYMDDFPFKQELVDIGQPQFYLGARYSCFQKTPPYNTVGTVLGVEDYQTYALWGDTGGILIAGLAPSTTYYVKVKAMQGKF